MKPVHATFTILLLLAASAHGQLLLNTGDVFTYRFHGLPDTNAFPCVTDRPVGGFSFSLAQGTFDANSDVLLVEMFENGTNEPPVTSFIAEANNDGTALSSAWADFEGTVRFTMISGSVTLERITFFFDTPAGEDVCDRSLQVFPVSAATLIAQLCPCAGPVSGGAWQNHGQYVSCVVQAAESARKDGVITAVERNAVVREAARSGCGKK